MKITITIEADSTREAAYIAAALHSAEMDMEADDETAAEMTVADNPLDPPQAPPAEPDAPPPPDPDARITLRPTAAGSELVAIRDAIRAYRQEKGIAAARALYAAVGVKNSNEIRIEHADRVRELIAAEAAPAADAPVPEQNERLDVVNQATIAFAAPAGLTREQLGERVQAARDRYGLDAVIQCVQALTSLDHPGDAQTPEQLAAVWSALERVSDYVPATPETADPPEFDLSNF